MSGERDGSEVDLTLVVRWYEAIAAFARRQEDSPGWREVATYDMGTWFEVLDGAKTESEAWALAGYVAGGRDGLILEEGSGGSTIGKDWEARLMARHRRGGGA